MNEAPGAGHLEGKVAVLLERLSDLGPLAVAMSGGVDSSFLLAAAKQVGGDLVALLGVSPSLPQASLERARRVSAFLGVRLREIETRELENPSYVANGPDRCYHCKRELYGVFRGLLAELEQLANAGGDGTARGYVMVDGTQADDLGDWRPGRQAARELGVRSPLLDLGWTKAEIRQVSRLWGLETADLPGGPCLSSRVPTGTPVDRSALARIEMAERALGRLGFSDVRVRDHGALARIELPVQEMGWALARRAEIVEAGAEAGYAEVTLDLRGYRPAGQSLRRTGTKQESEVSDLHRTDRSGG